MSEEGKKSKEIDIWMLLLVLFFLAFVVAGLWMTGRALDVRIDGIETVLKSEAEITRGEISELRKELMGSTGQPAEATVPKPTEVPTPGKTKK